MQLALYIDAAEAKHVSVGLTQARPNNFIQCKLQDIPLTSKIKLGRCLQHRGGEPKQAKGRHMNKGTRHPLPLYAPFPLSSTLHSISHTADVICDED